ncbi:hypothetical protein EJB05_06287, partial [Eragrostis curvula]
MGYLYPEFSTSSLLCDEREFSTSSLLCDESIESIFGFDDGEGETPECNTDLDFSSFAGLSLESDELEVVGSLIDQEREQLSGIATGQYLERLNSGGIESSWRTAAIEWIGKVQAHHNFGPLCICLAVNYLDRCLAINMPENKPWAQELLSIACLSLAAKMEETVVPHYLDFQVLNPKHFFETKSIERMEFHVLRSLDWRMNAVTPFSYIGYFADKFNEGNPLTSECVSRCTELILGTLKETRFLQFRPSEIAAAIVLSAVADLHALDFSSALLASEVPVDKENVRRCHEVMQEVALVKNTNSNVSPSIPKSPSGVLNASLFSFATDDTQTPGSSQANNDSKATINQICSPLSKRTRLDTEKMD